MKREKDDWSAKYITADYVSNKFVNRSIELTEPKSEWEKTWEKLVNSEILNLTRRGINQLQR